MVVGMKTVKADFEKNFKCIADKCPATCCKGWQICIDDVSLEKYLKYKGTLKDRVKRSVDFEEGTIAQKEDGSCAFLNDNGLCDWITADGEEILCDTCRLYPRHVEEYEDLREWSLSLSCPEAARMFVERNTRLSFETEENDESDPLEDEFEDFDIFLFEKLLDARELIFRIINNENLSFDMKASNILLLAGILQKYYDEDEIFEMEKAIGEFKIEENPDKALFSEVCNSLSVLDSLERLSDDWDELLLPALNSKNCEELKNTFTSKDIDCSLIQDNLLSYFIYTYFLGAVYNGMIYGYAAFCVFGTVALNYIANARKETAGRELSKEELGEIVYRFSRELEHSDDNISTVLEYFDGLFPA